MPGSSPSNDPPPLAPSGSPVTRLDSPARDKAFKGLFLLILLEPLVVVILLAAMGVRWWLIVAVVMIVFAFTAGVLLIIVHGMWRPFARRYPDQPIRVGAVSKGFQSFATSRFTRLNGCVTLIADDQHLHVEPPGFLKPLGAIRASIPWERIHNVRRSWAPGMMSADLDGRVIAAPDWCMKLAMTEAAEPSPRI